MRIIKADHLDHLDHLDNLDIFFCVLIFRDNVAMMASRHPTFALPEVDGDPDLSVYSVINLTIQTIT